MDATKTSFDVTGTQAETDDLDESERHRLLASTRRRAALDVLADRTAPVDVVDLAAAVAAREDGASENDDRAVDRVAVTLHHVHLPKLDGAGLVDYDTDAKRVESCPPSSDSQS